MSKPVSSKKRASLPEVGIFWIDDDGTMFADSVTLKDAEQAGDFADYGGSHYAIWDKAVRLNPKWKGLEYEQVPRGRVVCKMDSKMPMFTVYMAKRLSKFKKKVIARFNLPAKGICWDYSDEHYQM